MLDACARHEADFNRYLEEGVQASGWTWVNEHFGSPKYLGYKRNMAFKNTVLPA